MVLRLIPEEELLTEEEIEMLREGFALDAYVKEHPMPVHHGLRRLAAERTKAAANVEPLLRQTPRGKWLELTTHPDLRTEGALGHLHGLAVDARTGDPEYALAVAQLTVAVVEAMPEDAYPGLPGLPGILDYFRVQAWTNVGSSFRALGRYDEAIGALHTASSICGELGGARAYTRRAFSLLDEPQASSRVMQIDAL